MRASRLDRAFASQLDQANPTYVELGATADALPAGYRQIRREITAGQGPGCFAKCTRMLLTWQVHLSAGLTVHVTSDTIESGAAVVLGYHLGLVTIKAPCRIIYVVDEPRMKGFAYGTLPGHPESGEESFILRCDENERVTFAITAFSRPASILTKVAWPLGRKIQSRLTGRYLSTLARCC